MPELLQFVPPNFSADATALVIGDEKYLPQLRELMPAAKIALMTTENSSQLKKFCSSLKVDLMIGDYLNGALPNEPKIFDVIIADDCLTNSLYTYGIIAELGQLLKDSGFLLTKFFNARFIGMLESLRCGKFPTHEQKFWAKWDVVKLLHDAFYKEIYFMPEGKVDANVDEWVNFGFDNFSDDLLTKIWLVKACRSTAEVAALKEFFSEDVRADLSRLIRRIEYGIDVDENLSRLIELCRREKIFEDYLSDFIAQIVTHEDAKNFITKKAASQLG
ncbi:MAG: methyltransferase [Selenomonadaceae bacterium]|nr:methyltransferase [Selenomonadaceae bacterium]